MRPFCNPWLVLFLLLVGLASCASPPPPAVTVIPARTVPRVSEPSPTPATPEAPPLPPAVTENRTFVMVDGVPRYKIGPGDVLDIFLAKGFAAEKQTETVKGDGRLTIDLIAAKVDGLTEEQAAAEIRRILSPFYKEIRVEVAVKEYHSKTATVLGALGGLAGGGSVITLKGRMLLPEVIALAGGPGAIADVERVRVSRPGDFPLTISLFRLFEQPLAEAYAVDAGEVVYVPPRTPAVEPRIYTLGEVRNPGTYPHRPGMYLSHGLALAGGPTEGAFLASARVIRVASDTSLVLGTNLAEVLKGDLSQDLPLQPNDIIVVPRTSIGNWNAFIAKIRPSLEILTLPLSLPVQIKVLAP